jgi:hypothetical protein
MLQRNEKLPYNYIITKKSWFDLWARTRDCTFGHSLPFAEHSPPYFTSLLPFCGEVCSILFTVNCKARMLFNTIPITFPLRHSSSYSKGNRMRVLISGSSGFIGKPLVAALKSEGHEVFRLVRGVAGKEEEVSWNIKVRLHWIFKIT